MALKDCMAKAGKALDIDDRRYMDGLLGKGMSDEEVLSLLEKSIRKEQRDILKDMEAQGVAIKREVVPPPKKSEPRKQGPGERLKALLTTLSKNSDVIRTFLDTVPEPAQQIMFGGAESSYFAPEDAIVISGQVDGVEVDLSKPAHVRRLAQEMEHEITHAYTAAFISRSLDPTVASKQQYTDVKYLEKTVKALRELDLSKMPKAAAERVQYILSQSSTENQIIELVAVLNSEAEAATGIYGALSGWKAELKAVIKRIVEGVQKFLFSPTDEDIARFTWNQKKGTYKHAIDIELLGDALQRTVAQGKAFREQKADEFSRYSQALVPFNYGKKAPKIVHKTKASFDYINYAVASMVNARLEREGRKLIANAHNLMWEYFPLYQDAAEKIRGVYDGSPALQQLLHTITGEGANKVKKADVLAKFAAVNAQRTEIINDNIGKLTMLSKELSDKDKKLLDVFTSQMNIHDYFNFYYDLKTVEDIEAEHERLRKELWKEGAHREVRSVEKLVDWHIGGKLGTEIYNLSTSYSLDSDFGKRLRQFMVLESIKRQGTDDWVRLLKHEDLMDVIRDNSVANVLSTLQVAGTENVRDSLVQDYYKEPIVMEAFTESGQHRYEVGEKNGWKILRPATRTELGIAYKEIIDSSSIAGAYTDTKLADTDLMVDSNLKNYNGVVKAANGTYKLLVPKHIKQKAGLIEDFAQGLVRSTAHSMSLQESQIIRDSLLQDDTWRAIGSQRSLQRLSETIKAENVDNPWFVKLEGDLKYSELPDDIRAKYMPVGKQASNVRKFNEQVDLVRKDISHWLLGGHSRSLFDNPQMKWAMRILKDLISGAKIGMVVTNPVKIANDNLSNITYLGVVGVDPLFIAKNYKDITRDYAEYTELQRQIFQLKLQHVARPESTKIAQKLKSLQKRLEANPVGDLADKGFVNSLGSDLVSRSADTLSGFQADMHKALEYLLTTDSGKRNYVSHFIMRLQKIGFQAEDFFSYLGNLASKSKSTKLLEQELDQVADRLREIKTEEDIINYVAQFTTSPSSEFVRMGSAMTDLTDVLAKETLYRHFVENKGMSPQDARIEVLDSFPDYKENMPLAVKQLSDVGIIMFPSFWLRIQKVIYRMMRDKPINLATEMMIQDMVGSNVNTIFEANVINKSQTFGGIFHPPYEPIGFNSVFPTQVFG